MFVNVLLHPNAYYLGIAPLQMFAHSAPLAKDYRWSLLWRDSCTVARVLREWPFCCRLQSPAAFSHSLIVWIVCDAASLLIGNWYTTSFAEVATTSCRKDFRLTYWHRFVNSGISASCTHLCMQFRKTYVVFLTYCSDNACEHLAEGLLLFQLDPTRDPIPYDGSAPSRSKINL